MWANREIVELAEWLRAHNSDADARRRVGLLRAGRVLALGFDARGDGLSRSVDPTLASLRAPGVLRASSRTPRTCRSMRVRRRWCRCRVSTRWSRCCASSARSAPEFRDDGDEGYFNAEQNALVAQERRAVLPHDGARRPGVVERPRSAHGRDARSAHAAPRPDGEGDRLGAQHAHRRRAVHRHGARWNGERRPARSSGARRRRRSCSSDSGRIAEP